MKVDQFDEVSEVSACWSQCTVNYPFQDKFKVIKSIARVIIILLPLGSRFSKFSNGFRLLLDI